MKKWKSFYVRFRNHLLLALVAVIIIGVVTLLIIGLSSADISGMTAKVVWEDENTHCFAWGMNNTVQCASKTDPSTTCQYRRVENQPYYNCFSHQPPSGNKTPATSFLAITASLAFALAIVRNRRKYG